MICLAWVKPQLNLILFLAISLLGIFVHSIFSMVYVSAKSSSLQFKCKHIFRILVYSMLLGAKIGWVSSKSRLGFHQALGLLPLSLFWLLDVCYLRHLGESKTPKKELVCVAAILQQTIKVLLAVSLLLVDIKLEGGLQNSDWSALMWPVRIAAISLLVTTLVMLAGFLGFLQKYCSRRKSVSGLQVVWSGFFFFNVAVLAGIIGSVSYYFPACMESRSLSDEAQICLTVFGILCVIILLIGLIAIGFLKCPELRQNSRSIESENQPAINVQVNLQINLQIPQDILVTFIPIYNFPKYVMNSIDMADVFKPATLDDVRKCLSLPPALLKPKGKVLKLRSEFPEDHGNTNRGPGKPNPLANHLRNLSHQLMNLASSIEISTQGVASPDNHRRSQTVNAAMQQDTAKKSPSPQKHIKVQGDDSTPDDVSDSRSVAEERPDEPGKRLATELSGNMSRSLSNHSRQYSWANMPPIAIEAKQPSNLQNVFGADHNPNKGSCNVCYNKTPDSLFLPCGHAGLCTPCGKVIYETGKCCFCRKVDL